MTRRPWNIAFVLVALAGFASPSMSAQETPNASERKPILVLRELTAWGPRPQEGSKTIWTLNGLNPTFVLYNDGLVIFKKGKDSLELFSAELTPAEMHTWLEGLDVAAFLKLEDSYYTNNFFDQPTSVIYWQDHTIKRVMVSGPIRDSEADRNKAPQAFLKIFNRVITFHHDNARMWEPEKVQLHVIPYTDSEGEPVAWPKGWPDLNDKTTKDTSHAYGTGKSYSIHLSGDQRDELEQMLSGLKNKQAVLMNERSWYVSPHRYCLPGEELWIDPKSFACSAER